MLALGMGRGATAEEDASVDVGENSHPLFPVFMHFFNDLYRD